MQLGFYALPVALLVLFALEQAFPLRRPRRALHQRLAVNICVAALALTTVALVVRPVASTLLEHSSEFGLMSILSVPEAAQWVIVFLLLDVSFYYWHRANHVFGFLWRFHNAHHTDPDLDVSTAFRFHFVEIGLSAAFRAGQVALLGGSPWVFVAYELVFQLNTLVQHSNVRLPLAVERWLCLVLVTPRMHGIHHSQVREENNSNWSSVFSWWDRLHGTLCLNVRQSKVVIGIAGYSLPEDNRVKNVLLMAFHKQRDYWRSPGGTSSARRKPPDPASRSRMAP